ncbi:MAG: NAD(P)-dependent oxidoreductase [Ignavibacteriaceae bacterium]|nr:NAD(P)-dependent oxidoreductase [Eudoraea sp.]NNJ51689.1 NAD(P)-dependent oxidoreductase [Ignavibacteriaceae bacterium]
MKVLITGGTGFIGSRLAYRCKQRGDEVVILAQTNTPAEKQNTEELQRQGFTVVVGGITDKEKVAEAVETCDVVFHLAAAQHEANVADQHFWDVNVEGTRNLLDASINAKVKRFVHGSTIGVYGVEMQGELSETSALKPDNIYGVTKKAGEELVLSYKDKLPVTAIRISETYGPGDRRLLKLYKGIKKRKFFVIGDGKNIHQLIFVDDLIDGMFQAAEKDAALGEIFVLAGGEILSTNEMVDIIANVLKVRKIAFRVPMWPFYLLAIVMEKTLRPLGIAPPLHRRRLDFFKKTLFFSNSKSSKLLGFKAKTDFKTGSETTISWYRDQDLL